MAWWNKAGSIALEALLENQFKEFKNELKGELALVEGRLNERIDEVRDELKGDIKEVRDELKGDIKGVRDELKGDIKGVRDELKADIKEVKGDLKAHEEKCVDRQGEIQQVKGAINTMIALASRSQPNTAGELETTKGTDQ